MTVPAVCSGLWPYVDGRMVSSVAVPVIRVGCEIAADAFCIGRNAQFAPF